MSDHDQAVVQSSNGSRGRPRRIASFDDFSFGEEQPADVATGLVSVGFLWAAIRRSARLWGALAVIGLIIGLGYYFTSPPAVKASTSVLLTYGQDESPASAIFDNQTMAESHAVASLAMKKLGDTKDVVGTFAASYVVGVVTDRILDIQASAPTSAQAVARANAIAAAFLQFRAGQEKAIQQAQVAQLTGEVATAQASVEDLQAKIATERAQGATAAQLKSLTSQLNQAQVNFSTVQQLVGSTKAGSSVIQATAGSVVLDPASPLPASKTKKLAEYAAYGIIGGLAIGIAIAAIGAIISDRLRRRDDVARALGSPVRLSVGPVRLSGRLPRSKRGLEAAGDAEVRQIVAHLEGVMPSRERKVALAVIPVGAPAAAALATVALAVSCAEDGRRVVLADLAAGAPAAALLGVAGPGVTSVSAGSAQVVLAVPGPGEVAPAGPVGRAPEGARSKFSEEVAAACGPADLLLTLATLDPALGADHLASWASNGVAMVTAGTSSWGRLHAAGEMARLAGITLISTILVGADRSDESLGVIEEPAPLLGLRELS
ncbi:MAG TPA: hypothetical protein VH478_03805 [Trebonia sp.]|jgi:hypothetical protein|nr:hypothetical protein [Trebonia sp.]